MLRALLLTAIVAIASPARAEQIDTRAKVTTQRRVAAVAVAVMPGIFVRGAGSYLAGESRTARRLATMGAIGLGGMLVGGIPVGISGGYPPTVIGVPILLAGAGLFLTSWWADIATAAGLRHAGVPRAIPPWSLELATVWQHDAHRERGFVRAAARADGGRLGLGAAAMIDAEGRALVGEAELRARILGAPPTGAVTTSGSRLYARLGGRVHDDEDDRVTLATGEVELVGRLDLRRVDHVLDGTFVHLSSGIGIERARYPGDTDLNSVLLGTFGWGAYLGERGEAGLFYDHRRDSLQGGIAAYRAAGFVGSLGAYVDVLVAPRIAVRGQFDLGSSYLATFGIRYQGGPR